MSLSSFKPLEKMHHPLPGLVLKQWGCVTLFVYSACTCPVDWWPPPQATSIWAEVQLHFVTAQGAQRYQVVLCGWEDVVYLREFVLCLLSLCLCSADFLTSTITLSGKETSHIRTESFSTSRADFFSFSKRSMGCAAIDRAAWFSMSVVI